MRYSLKNNLHARRLHEAGSALITTILFIAVATAVVVGFLTLATEKRSEARDAFHQLQAEMILESARQEILAKIMDSSELPYAPSNSGGYRAAASMTACPGLAEIRYYDAFPNRGYHTGAAAFTATNSFFRNPFQATYERKAAQDWAPANPRLIPLFSWNTYAPAMRWLTMQNSQLDPNSVNPGYNPDLVFNLNTPHNPFHPGEFYLSGPSSRSYALKYATDESGQTAKVGLEDSFRIGAGESSADRPLYVQWIPMRANPQALPGPDNPVIGRYAYWIDVENTKVHLDLHRRFFELSAWAALAGLSDAEMNHSTLSYFAQSADNPSRSARDWVEKKLTWAGTTPSAPKTRDGETSEGDSVAASFYFQSWFGWNSVSDPEYALPYTADASMVSARALDALKPVEAQNFSLQPLAQQYSRSIALHGKLNSWEEIASFIDPASDALPESMDGRAILATLRRTLEPSTTIYGYEDELDPLGRSKIDIVRFQQEGIPSSLEGAPGTLWHDLTQRLKDSDYHRAYTPNAYPTYGSGGLPSGARSFRDSLNGFAGDLNPENPANGDAAVAQMLVNLAEYARPHDSISTLSPAFTSAGIWPAKSMPYVAEVATRARSAAFLLQPQDRIWNKFYAQTNVAPFNYVRITNTLTGIDGIARENWWYMTNALIDLSIGLVNPNPFATNLFSGTFILQGEDSSFWAPGIPLYPNNVYPCVSGPTIQMNFSGVYTARGAVATAPAMYSEQVGIRASGNALYFNLGALPSSTLASTNGNNPTALRIKGWQIWQNGQLFHQVPMRHLGSNSTPRSWWQMAELNANAGPTNSLNSLVHYRMQGSAVGTPRAVGWFTPRSIGQLTNSPYGFTNLICNDSNFPVQVSPSQFSAQIQPRILEILSKSTTRALIERVQCIDPKLGHRTGDPSLLVDSPDIGGQKQGHFYGAAGHPWRLYYWRTTNQSLFSNATYTQPNYQGVSSNITPTQAPQGNQAKVAQEISWQRPAYGAPTTETFAGVLQPESDDCLTMHFSNPNVTICKQMQMKGAYLVNYGRQPLTGASVTAVSFNFGSPLGVWPVDLEPALGAIYNANIRSGGQGPGAPSEIAGLLASAPRGEPMTSIGEIGFVHSGFPQRPMNLSAHGWLGRPGFSGGNSLSIGAPQNGPPQAMLLDLFTPHPFRSSETGDPLYGDVSSWAAGSVQHSPGSPRRGTLNVNSMIAQDLYLAVREGSPSQTHPLGFFDPANMALHPAWTPCYATWRRSLSDRSESQLTPSPGDANGGRMDSLLDPALHQRRGWEMLMSVIGADFSCTQSPGSGSWQDSSAMPLGPMILGAPLATWSCGRGATADALNQPLVSFDDSSNSLGQVLTLGVDRRASVSDSGYMAGLFAADQLSCSGSSGILSSANDLTDEAAPIRELKGPLVSSTRFALTPLRHFISEAALDMARQNDFKSMNPYATDLALENHRGPLAPSAESRLVGELNRSGIFKNMALAQVANSISTSANAFRLHIVVQVVRDNAPARANVPLSGPGYIDQNDHVLSEIWNQTVLLRLTEKAPNGDIARYTAANAPSTELIGAPIYHYKIAYEKSIDQAP